MSRVNKYRGKRIGKEEWIIGFYTQLPKVSIGATIVADGDLCAEDVADYIIVNKSKQHSNFSNAYPLEVVECEQYEVDPDTIGQYIGVPDKNGKEIYEGDIVKIHQFLFDGCEYEKEIIVSIEYMEEMACFGANLLQAKEIREYMGYNNETDKEEKVVVPLCELYGLHEESFEVVGNVYENADLLKADWCPLLDLPKKKEVRNFFPEEADFEQKGYQKGFNTCINEILNAVFENPIPYNGDNIGSRD